MYKRILNIIPLKDFVNYFFPYARREPPLPEAKKVSFPQERDVYYKILPETNNNKTHKMDSFAGFKELTAIDQSLDLTFPRALTCSKRQRTPRQNPAQVRSGEKVTILTQISRMRISPVSSSQILLLRPPGILSSLRTTPAATYHIVSRPKNRQ
jgi:hypothetical protein